MTVLAAKTAASTAKAACFRAVVGPGPPLPGGELP